MIFHFLIFVIRNIGLNTFFLHYEYFKHVFLQHFLNHGFYIILNNNTSILLPNRSRVYIHGHFIFYLVFYSFFTYFEDEKKKKDDGCYVRRKINN